MSWADFGPLVIETDVDAAVVGVLGMFLPTYLARVEAERGLTNRLLARPRPECYMTVLEDEAFPESRLPSILVTTAKTASEPEKDGDENYYAAWTTVVSTVCRGRTPTEARAVAALFGGCVRRLLVHQSDLGGFANQVKWTGSPGLAPVKDKSGQDRHLVAAFNEFTVFVDDVLQGDIGPMHPDNPGPVYPPVNPSDPDTPYDPLVLVTGVDISTIIRED